MGVRYLTWQVANPGLISGITYEPLRTAKSGPRVQSQEHVLSIITEYGPEVKQNKKKHFL